MGPSPRYGHALTYDPNRARVVLFAGQDDSGPLADLWEWDGVIWTQLAASIPPVGRRHHGWVYDPIGASLLAVGGYNGAVGSFDDTWTARWDGGTLDEACASGVDVDGDGAVGCADDECWPWCTPTCSATLADHAGCDPAAAPRCGDGSCGPAESCGSCPDDCGACPSVCGDLACTGAEDATWCPGDCDA
ncbi:MAG: kelch repeat-containing protein [Kofleriaceae bacterium]